MKLKKVRLFAILSKDPRDPRVKHYLGYPPGVGDKPGGARSLLPAPKVLLIEEENGGSATLIRIAANGGFAGDTWHTSIEEAKRQAAYEYGDAVGEWTEVPERVGDPAGFALGLAKYRNLHPE